MLQLFKSPNIDFMGRRRLWITLSCTLTVLALAVVAIKGVKLGVEFEGGAEVQVQYKTAQDVHAVREMLARQGYASAIVTTIGKPDEHEIYIRVPLVAGAKDEDVAPAVVKALSAEPGAPEFEVRSKSYIGPAIGSELMKKALWAILGSLGGMLGYIWIRFHFEWGLAAVVALIHDTILTLGLFSLFGFEMSLSVVAAFLTLVGYSVNDTVVVFDRVRENLNAKGGTSSDLIGVINHSINQTLSRTILTSFLTWLVCVCLFALGGPPLRGFSFTMVIGIIVGTYSSIYVASPILVTWQAWRKKRAQAAAAASPSRSAARKVRVGKA